jgi:hypothetical protein
MLAPRRQANILPSAYAAYAEKDTLFRVDQAIALLEITDLSNASTGYLFPSMFIFWQ